MSTKITIKQIKSHTTLGYGLPSIIIEDKDLITEITYYSMVNHLTIWQTLEEIPDLLITHIKKENWKVK